VATGKARVASEAVEGCSTLNERAAFAVNIFSQPRASRIVDTRPSRFIARDIRYEYLILYPNMRFQFVAYLFQRLIGSNNPDCFQMVPLGAQRLYSFYKLVVCRTMCGMDIVGDKYRGAFGLHQLSKCLMFRRGSVQKKAFNLYVRDVAA
jgi:hypothetical protein